MNPDLRRDRFQQATLPAAAALLSLFAFALSTSLLPAALLRASADLAVTPQALATVSSAQFAAFVLVAAFAGFLSDRWGKRGIFLGACALFVVGAGLWGTARSLAQGCVAAVLWGVAGGVLEGMSSALLCELFPTRRKLFMNVSQVLYTVGAVLGPWVAGRLLPWGMDWRWLFLGVGALGGGLWFLFLGCRLPSPLPHEQVTLKRLLPEARTWAFLSCCLALFLYVLSESAVAMYANLYLHQAHAAPENWAIYSIAVFWGAMLVGRGACAFLPEHYSYEKTLAVLLGFSGITLALQGFAGGWRTSVALFALSGLVFSGSWPLLVALTSSRAPRHGASLVGLAIAAGAVGCIAAPPLMNVLLALLPSRWVFVAMSFPMFLAAGCAIGHRKTAAVPCPSPLRASAVLLAFLALTGLPVPHARATETSVTVRDCVVVVSSPTNDVVQVAARELQKHLQLVTGQDVAVTNRDASISGKYPFHVGIAAPADEKPLAPEEARWEVAKDGVWLYGDESEHRLGPQFAVDGFLEERLGVRWIEPGDRGIAFKKQSPLLLKVGASHWVPELRLRKIRMRDRPMTALPKLDIQGNLALFEGFRRSLEEQNQDAVDGMAWQKRMRMGGHDTPNFGHAFTKWWDRFHKDHPDYFALTHLGKREPLPDPRPREAKTAEAPFTERERSFVKLCVSNPKVAEQILNDWLPRKDLVRYLNTCENDMPYGYCQCEQCTKLDVPLAGEKVGRHLTDRYVFLANRVAREARKHRPDAIATMHAYSETEQPPRRERLDPNVYVSMAPTTFALPELQRWFDGWRVAGATAIQLRPNFHWYYATISVPMGYERHLFDVFQLAVKDGCIAADFDSIKRNWPTTGMFNYILAKAMSDPSKPYEFWEDHYLSAYGVAAPDLKEYHRYWREEVWEKRLRPAIGQLAPAVNPNFCGALLQRLGEFYRVEDFDRTDAILQAAGRKALDPSERARLDRLALANQHARLVFNAVTTPMPGKLDPARKLLEFRKKHGKDLSVTWIDIIAFELGRKGEEDLAGLAAAAKSPAP